MPTPDPTRTQEPLNWHPAVRDILGMQDNVDPFRVASMEKDTNPSWLTLDLTFWESRWATETTDQTPWNHWMPNGKDWNAITVYRIRNTGQYLNFQLIRANVVFYGDSSGGDELEVEVLTGVA